MKYAKCKSEVVSTEFPQKTVILIMGSEYNLQAFNRKNNRKIVKI